MSKTITLSISSEAKILVSSGEKITSKTPLVKFSEKVDHQTIHLAKLLGVPASKIPKFLKKKIGESVSAGDVIAEKKGLFSSSVVRSPLSGKLGELDLAKGTINLVKYSEDQKDDLISPVSGKIVSVAKSYLEIEVDNPIFKAIKGDGNDTVGKLKYVGGSDLGTLDVDGDVEDCIILCKSVKEETLVKLQVLGTRGGIFLKIKDEGALPWILVEENTFKNLIDFDAKLVWLRPKEKQVIILE